MITFDSGTKGTNSSTSLYTPVYGSNYITTATTDNLTEELEGYIGLPINNFNISRIKDTITSYIYKETGTGRITLGAYSGGNNVNYYQGTSTETGAGTDNYTLGVASNVKVYCNHETGCLEILYNGTISESAEDKKKREERQKKEEALYRRIEKQEQIKNNLLIKVNSRAKLISKIPDNELVAMETLREVITETEFRKYLKYGFVLVKGRSGKTYQIFRNNSHTKVWLGGKLVEEICVKIADYNIPPTDNVIAVKTMLETSEEECYKLANIYKMEKAA